MKDRNYREALSDRVDTVDSHMGDFIVWLTTQTNANGSTFLKHVAQRYARSLASIPIKLDIPLTTEERNVFHLQRIDEFDRIEEIFRTAPNYKEVNHADHCSFSAGLGAYRRYVEYLNNRNDNGDDIEAKTVFVVQQTSTTIEQSNPDYCVVDFTNTDVCSRSHPIKCSINGVNIPFVGNWCDLLVAITEYCILEYADKMETLKSKWFSKHTDTPYLLSSKPLRSGRKLSNGYWINVHYGISYIVRIIAGICSYCGINLNNVEITYLPKIKDNLNDDIVSVMPSNTILLNPIISVLWQDYHYGFNFNTTSIRLLAEKTGIDIDTNIQEALKNVMFCRNDSVYFLLDIVVGSEMQDEIINVAEKWLTDYGCFEISELYAQFIDNINKKAIRNLDDFVAFYEHIHRRNVRCITHYGTRIARIQKENICGLFSKIATNIISIIHKDEFGGVISEDDLRTYFPAFSVDLLSNIIKEYIEEFVKTEINGIVCYQTVDAIGLSDEFSNTLAEVLEQLDELSLPPSEEILHTALSIKLGVNFKAEYNITDDKAYRRLIAAYYKEATKRDWKKGIFAEVQD